MFFLRNKKIIFSSYLGAWLLVCSAPSVACWIDYLSGLMLRVYTKKLISLYLNQSIFCGHSKELSHRDGSFEYLQHMFWLRNKKNNFQLHTLIWGPGYGMGGTVGSMSD